MSPWVGSFALVAVTSITVAKMQRVMAPWPQWTLIPMYALLMVLIGIYWLGIWAVWEMMGWN